ncbi:MAG TPA: FlgD immunoglobulin-like domain containing protein [Candidatus Cloacimonadota bacterium]|nr:FlgD immunoglobulin-like domain containing protein [Candidatus Cloacimonadota bacterium]
MRRIVIAILLVFVTTTIFARLQDSPDNAAGKTPGVMQAPGNIHYTAPNDLKWGTDLLVPLDETFTLALEANDDGFTAPIEIPFNFVLYGTQYTQFYINNNGNISFLEGYSTYTPFGFPIDGYPMLAPFFGDVDTRGVGSGLVWYKIESNRIIVTWDHVGYFGARVDKLNTFQVIFSDGTDPAIGLGNNVAFSYGEMAWTTGDASGGTNGLGGTPATVGVNAGDGDLYSQTGRFDHQGYDYDGAYGNYDGVNWLTFIIFFYNVVEPVATLTIIPTDIENPMFEIELPTGVDPLTDTIETFYASYPVVGTMNVNLPVGPGTWRAWIYHTGAWHQAAIFPFTGPGTLVFEDVPFGAKADVPILLEHEEQTLPVVLSSFNAVLTTQNYVKLQWVTQSETGVSGYNIYRSLEQEVNSALLISPLITATNLSYEQSYQFIDTEIYDPGIYYYWLQSRDFDGTSNFFGPVQVRFQPQDPGGEIPSLPLVTDLLNAYPNPFNPSTSIRYSVSEATTVNLSIFNTRGQLIRSFTANPTEPGYYSQYWDGLDQAGNPMGSGVYLIKMTSSGSSFLKRVILSK